MGRRQSEVRLSAHLTQSSYFALRTHDKLPQLLQLDHAMCAEEPQVLTPADLGAEQGAPGSGDCGTEGPPSGPGSAKLLQPTQAYAKGLRGAKGCWGKVNEAVFLAQCRRPPTTDPGPCAQAMRPQRITSLGR